MPKKTILFHILRFLFGAIFIWSGVAKLKDPIGFTDAIRNFELVKDPLPAFMALSIPWVEIIAGIVTLAGIIWRGGVATLIGSLVVFTGALVIAWARGLDISCGCFGGTGAVNYPLVVGRNVLLLVFGAWLLIKSGWLKPDLSKN